MDNWFKFYEDINAQLKFLDENLVDIFNKWKDENLEQKVRQSKYFLYDWQEFKLKVWPPEKPSLLTWLLSSPSKEGKIKFDTITLQQELWKFIGPDGTKPGTKVLGYFKPERYNNLLLTDTGALLWTESYEHDQLVPKFFSTFYFEEELRDLINISNGIINLSDKIIIDDIFFDFYQNRMAGQFNLTKYLPTEKYELENSTFLIELKELNKNCKEEDIDDVFKLHNFIKRRLDEINGSFAQAIEANSLNLLEEESFLNDKINLIEDFKEQLLFVLGMIDYRNLMMRFLREGDRILFMELKYKLDDLGVYFTKFERENLEKLDSINNNLKELIDAVQVSLQTINDTLQQMQGTIESVDEKMNEINSKADASLFLSAINTYQLYKVHKSLKN